MKNTRKEGLSEIDGQDCPCVRVLEGGFPLRIELQFHPERPRFELSRSIHLKPGHGYAALCRRPTNLQGRTYEAEMAIPFVAARMEKRNIGAGFRIGPG